MRKDGKRRTGQKGSWLLSVTLYGFRCPGAVQLVLCAWSRWDMTGLILFFLMLVTHLSFSSCDLTPSD